MTISRIDKLQWTTILVIAVNFLPTMGCVPGGFTPYPDCVPRPTIKSISPQAVTAGSPDFALQVTGKDFHSYSFLTINGHGRTTMIGGEHELSALIEQADIAQPGTAQIVVITPPPKDSCGGGISNPATLRIAQ